MKPTIYNQLKNKTNYLKDLTLIIKILKSFKNVINSNEEMQEFNPANIEYKHIPSKSITFYLNPFSAQAANLAVYKWIPLC